MDVGSLPNDIFLLIIVYLSPSDIIRCRRVSRHWKATFAESDLSRYLLQQHYPRVRELRDVNSGHPPDWPDTFATVAARYHFLLAGKPRHIEKFALRNVAVPKWETSYSPIAPWQRYLQFKDKTANFHYPDPFWTYDDGILIFPPAAVQRYAVYDLDSGTVSGLDFELSGKIVRRIRLKEKVLVVEWCEQEAYHKLNESEIVYRHFATAYDLVQNAQVRWNIVFRSEWKFHFLGMPLTTDDRFYSTHTAHHYALYLWQPNRSSWGEDDPIEALAIWDISSPSQYRPSEDPTGESKPRDELEGPKVVRRLSFADLDFYNIRQRSTPTLHALALDESYVYVIEEDHRWLVGHQANHVLPRLHKVKTIGIPFTAGPRWEDECGIDGDVNLSYCEKATDQRHSALAPCWRHEEFPYLTITEAFDTYAGVRFCARHCFKLETISIQVKTTRNLDVRAYEISLRDDLWSQLLGKGKICGDERWLIGENTNQELVILHFDGKPDTPSRVTGM